MTNKLKDHKKLEIVLKSEDFQALILLDKTQEEKYNIVITLMIISMAQHLSMVSK